MRSRQAQSGPFKQSYTSEEIERICEDALMGSGLMPTEPGPVRVERFVERRFGLSPTYDMLPDGVLRYTVFGPKGPQAMRVSRALR